MSVSDGKKIKQSKKIKIIGISVATISAVALGVILVIALITRGNNGFTVKIDNPYKSFHFKMSETPEGTSATFLSGTPAEKIYPTTAEVVETYLDTFDVDSISGSHNLADTNPSREGYYNAVVYTVFLENTSASEEQKFTYSVNLDQYSAPTNSAYGTLDYLRVLIATSTVDSSKDMNKDLNMTYFSLKSETGYGTMESTEDDRECVSKYKLDENADHLTVRSPVFTSKGGAKYCDNFMTNANDSTLVLQELTLKPSEKIRFTFVSYLEGEDPDCRSFAPDASTILLSLHFGL